MARGAGVEGKAAGGQEAKGGASSSVGKLLGGYTAGGQVQAQGARGGGLVACPHATAFPATGSIHGK